MAGQTGNKHTYTRRDYERLVDLKRWWQVARSQAEMHPSGGKLVVQVVEDDGRRTVVSG